MAVVQLETGDRQPENGFVTPETASPELLTHIDESVLPSLGGFGKYQKQLIVLTWIPALFIGFSQFSDSFLLAEPNITCTSQPLANGTRHTANLQMDISTGPALYAGGGPSGHNYSMQCQYNESTFELHTGLEQNVVTKWCLVCELKWRVHIAKFSLLVGSIFGYLVFGILADWFGRHPVLIISVLFMLVFGLTVAFSVNVTMFSTLRFFEGFCLAGITLSLYVLRIELCLPAWRFSMTMVASFVVLGGQLLMPGVAYLCHDWQVLQAVIICPLLLMLSYIWIFPESLRWLLATQQYCRSKWIMGHIETKNKVNLERDADNILTELQNALQKKPKRTCIVKMAGTRNLWKNIVVLCVNSLTGYGIHHCFARSMVSPENEEKTIFRDFYAEYYTKAGIAVASCIALCPAVGLMGRRGGLLMFMIITALASLLQLGLLNLLWKYSNHLNIEQKKSTLNRNFSIAFSIIGMFSSHAVSNLSIFFCAEITPTVIRGGGVGLVLASAGFGMLTAPIMDLHNQKGYFLHHIIFACCTLICIICILLLPETRNQSLPETIDDGENYTRQPLLLQRKLGEQDLLLHQLEPNRDYSRVQDTPLHETANVALSTMASTASSAVDLPTLAAGDLSVTNNLKEGLDLLEPQDPSGHSSPFPLSASAMSRGKDVIIQANKECLLSSSPLHKAPCATDPLLADAEELLVVQESTDNIHLEVNNTTPSPKTKDGPGIVDLHVSSPPIIPQTLPASLLICTTPVIEPRPSSILESPNPLENDIDEIITTSKPLVSEDAPSISENLLPTSDLDQPAQTSTSSTPQFDIPPKVEKILETACTPDIRNSQPPHLDLMPFNGKDISSHSSTPPSLVAVSPKHTCAPPTDSDPTPFADSSSVYTTARSPTVLPVTDIVNTIHLESSTNIVQDSVISLDLNSVQSNSNVDVVPVEAAPISLMDSTVSSPIDSGVIATMDRETSSTENNSVNGTAST
ncbi:solute carrier family 22 member 23-like [Poeciliopsis prolifica]|uniref:solute carrier family 22 member 23-like n=1 Tax=Poeciliopsis prolifica TaxID=188132 RepID=UPI0024133CAD|nr:solute carrier family 22 member 23-like [Poeciliopsis prolifica]XP_054888481.1 solute carrier family 22 member 23-like [Poeciliopsis prolifica]